MENTIKLQLKLYYGAVYCNNINHIIVKQCSKCAFALSLRGEGWIHWIINRAAFIFSNNCLYFNNLPYCEGITSGSRSSSTRSSEDFDWMSVCCHRGFSRLLPLFKNTPFPIDAKVFASRMCKNKLQISHKIFLRFHNGIHFKCAVIVHNSNWFVGITVIIVQGIAVSHSLPTL